MAVQHKKPCQKARSNEKQDELWTVRFGSIFVKARSSGENQTTKSNSPLKRIQRELGKLTEKKDSIQSSKKSLQLRESRINENISQ